MINGNCYVDGEVNPENPLEICNATRNDTALTESTPTGITYTSASGEFFCCLISLLLG